jgi:hypothetical protein
VDLAILEIPQKLRIGKTGTQGKNQFLNSYLPYFRIFPTKIRFLIEPFLASRILLVINAGGG